MRIKRFIFGILIVSLIPAMILRSKDADTSDIEKVLNKQVLDSADLQIIDDFLARSIQELVKTKDFTDIARTRTVILSHQSPQGQYAQQFSESAYKYISLGFQQARKLSQERQFRVILNLLILIDGLQDPRLIDLAIERLKEQNKAICYWAVRCVTNPVLVRKLNPAEGANMRLLQRIATQLKELVDSTNPEVLALMAEFAAEVNIPEAEDLLLQVAETRIKRYADWKVEYELLDSAILKFLYNKMASTGSRNPAIARSFGQLYSYIMQRYIKGQDVLNIQSKNQLASVLVETEDKCIGKLLGRPQSTIKRAVERKDFALLSQEHDNLLGNETGAGQLALKLNFDFSTDSNGNKMLAPRTLPNPPQK